MVSPPTFDSLLSRGRAAFVAAFGGQPTLAASAPGRVNLIGEHTDYNDGFVMPLALDRRTLLLARPRAGGRFSLLASEIDQSVEFGLDDCRAPAPPGWTNYIRGVIAQFLKLGITPPGLDIAIVSDVPVGSGLSSSAALEVAAATLLEAATGRGLSDLDKARLCQATEHQFAGVPCGLMDMTISIMGRQDHALLLDCRSFAAEHVPLKDASVVVVNSGVKHSLGDGEYARRRQSCEQAVKTLAARRPAIAALRDATPGDLEAARSELDPLVYRRARHVVTEDARTLRAVEALRRGDLPLVGSLMLQSHHSLREDYEVSCPELDILVELAMQVPGVHGARMTGGGFGGCTVSLVEPAAVAALLDHINDRYPRLSGHAPTAFATRPSAGARVETV